MVITFKRFTYDAIPEKAHRAIIRYEKDKVRIDETLLSETEMDKLREYFLQEGWVEL